MKIDMPNVPELADVDKAVGAAIVVSKVPCGILYTTTFLDKDGEKIRQDQHCVVDSNYLALQGAIG